VGAEFEPYKAGSWNCMCWYVFKGWTTFTKTIFCEKQEYERGGWLNIKIHILFYGDNLWTFAIIQMKFGTVKYHGHAYKFNFHLYFIREALKYGDGVKYWYYVGTSTEPL
jgi:hypothetical protein